MRRLWILAAAALPLLVALTGCEQMPGARAEADPPLRPSAVLDFHTLYSQNCQACHGTAGQN
ncbi:MAG: cytochrome c, partial [Acidobacteriaceae bacterium]